jgi:two-component system, LytTR family, response regulator
MTDTAGTISVLVVDDEEPARLLLREMLEAIPGVRVAGEAANGLEALGLAARERPDLVLLDVQMPRMDGFETLDVLDPRIAVVFVTAYDEYALRAFEVNAVDYLMKPFPAVRLAEAVERARARIGRARDTEGSALAAAARPAGTYATRIVVRDGPRVDVLPVDQVEYARGQADYVELVAGGRSYLKQQTLQALEASQDPAQFVRIHRSYLVNLAFLKRIEPWGSDSRQAVMADGEELPISRAGLARLNEILDGKR